MSPNSNFSPLQPAKLGPKLEAENEPPQHQHQFGYVMSADDLIQPQGALCPASKQNHQNDSTDATTGSEMSSGSGGNSGNGGGTSANDGLGGDGGSVAGTSASKKSRGGEKKRAKKAKSFQCPYCPVKLSNRGQLRGHERIHTGERPYVCDWPNCSKTFTRNEELTRHKKTHTKERPYPCRVCNKPFGRKDHLKKHERTHEKKIKPKAGDQSANPSGDNRGAGSEIIEANMQGLSLNNSSSLNAIGPDDSVKSEIVSGALELQDQNALFAPAALAPVPAAFFSPASNLVGTSIEQQQQQALMAAANFTNPSASLLMAQQSYQSYQQRQQQHQQQQLLNWAAAAAAGATSSSPPHSQCENYSSEALAAAAANHQLASIASMNNALAMQHYAQQQQHLYQPQYQPKYPRLTEEQMEFIYQLAHQSFLDQQHGGPGPANHWKDAK